MSVTPSCVSRLFVPFVLFMLLAFSIPAAFGSSFAVVGVTQKMLTPETLAAANKTETFGHISPDGKTLIFGHKAVRLVVETGPEDDMLSYRIQGRRNPTLVIDHGAVVRLLFVNTDDDMAHDLRFGPALKTYPNSMAAYKKSSLGTGELPHKSSAALYGEEMTLRAPDKYGRYTYCCTVRGHAQGGMFGEVIVR